MHAVICYTHVLFCELEIPFASSQINNGCPRICFQQNSFPTDNLRKCNLKQKCIVRNLVSGPRLSAVLYVIL